MPKFKPSEFLFFLAGAGILVSLPWLSGAGLFVWLGAKAAYFLGVLVYIKEIRS